MLGKHQPTLSKLWRFAKAKKSLPMLWERVVKYELQKSTMLLKKVLMLNKQQPQESV